MSEVGQITCANSAVCLAPRSANLPSSKGLLLGINRQTRSQSMICIAVVQDIAGVFNGQLVEGFPALSC